MRAVVVGNSAASLAAAETFRRYDRVSELVLISDEPGPAYSRVLLPYYLRGSLPRERLFIRDTAYYGHLNVRTLFGRTVRQVRDRENVVVLDDGEGLPYDRLLVASGARPCAPAIQDLRGPGIHYLWSLEEADRLAAELIPGRRVALIGSGFVSMQAAWSARARGMGVAVLEALPRILPKVLDEKASALLEAKIREHGVEVRCSAGIERIERRQPGSSAEAPLRIILACGEPPVEADLIVVGAGARPCLELLRDTEVKTAEGILVDDRMRTSVANIFAAGDVAQAPSVFGEPHVVQALWPTAVEQGRVAGANMAGADRRYAGSLNMNVAEMFGLTVASMGRFLQTGAAGESAVTEHDPKAGRYLKLLFQDGVPVGGLVLGSPEDLAVLAALRPRIRARRQARVSLERPLADLHLQLGRPQPIPAARSAG